MGSVVVRNLDASIIERLRHQAGAAGRSMEAQIREILRQAVSRSDDFDALAAQLRELTAKREQTPSEVLLREDRDR